jgi:hypothetical protein
MAGCATGPLGCTKIPFRISGLAFLADSGGGNAVLLSFSCLSGTAGSRNLGEEGQPALLIGLKGGIRRFVNGHFAGRPLPIRG